MPKSKSKPVAPKVTWVTFVTKQTTRGPVTKPVPIQIINGVTYLIKQTKRGGVTKTKLVKQDPIEKSRSTTSNHMDKGNGPDIPKHPLPTVSATTGNDAEESDEDDYTPALPPELVAARKAGPSEPSKRVLGPTLPTARPDPDSDSDDDVGPQPLPSHVRTTSPSGVDEFLEREARRRENAAAANKPAKPVREAWMLVPPTPGLRALDPTRLKARQFGRTAAESGGSSLWTETPAERQQRLADEVSGRKRPAGAAPVEDEDEVRKRRRRDADIRRGVDQHTRKVRGPALVEAHMERAPTLDEDGPPAIWDHARDMSLGGRLMDDTQRQKLLRDAKGLGDRFGAGKSGGFL